jgi:DNA-binding NarL/FixJ family response regulator
MKAYEDALVLLDDVARTGRGNGDTYLQMSERTARCRINLLRRDIVSASRTMDVLWDRVASSGQYAEFLACRALALGMLQKGTDYPFALLAEAERRSRENEATLLCGCVRALLTLDRDASSAAMTMADVFRTGMAKGVVDPLVFAFRIDDRLASLLGEDEALRPALTDLMAIVDATGLEQSPVPRRTHPFEDADTLTKREREVLEFVAEGKTNLEIATRLFLTPGTVKVHVRSILRKLGLRSRTEAAIYAVRMQQHEVRAHESRPRRLSHPDSRF